MFGNGSELNGHLYRGPSKDSSYQVLIHLTRRFRGEDCLEIDQSETRMARGGHVCQRIGTKCTILIEDLTWLLPTKFQFIWPCSFREADYLEINQSETRIARGGHIC